MFLRQILTYQKLTRSKLLAANKERRKKYSNTNCDYMKGQPQRTNQRTDWRLNIQIQPDNTSLSTPAHTTRFW